MVASLDHAMWFMRPFRADEWLLYDQSSPSAGGGRALTQGKIFTRAGQMVAAVMQEGLTRYERGYTPPSPNAVSERHRRSVCSPCRATPANTWRRCAQPAPRRPPCAGLAELDAVDALVIPGGESTAMSLLLREFDLLDPLRRRLADGMPAYGSCAGMILLASEILDAGAPGREASALGAIDMTVRRNAFGRQVDSFEGDIDVPRTRRSGPCGVHPRPVGRAGRTAGGGAGPGRGPHRRRAAGFGARHGVPPRDHRRPPGAQIVRRYRRRPGLAGSVRPRSPSLTLSAPPRSPSLALCLPCGAPDAFRDAGWPAVDSATHQYGR